MQTAVASVVLPIVAASPALAVAAAAPGDQAPDPIFALIEHHRKLQAEAMALDSACNELEETLPDELTGLPRGVPTVIGRDFETAYNVEPDGREVFTMSPRPAGQCNWAVNAHQIRKDSEAIPEEHREDWIADRLGALRRAQRKLRRAQNKAGLTRARALRMNAIDAEYAAARALIQTVPTTPAGVAALARYVVDCHQTTTDVTPDEHDHYDLLATIAVAASRLAAQS